MKQMKQKKLTTPVGARSKGKYHSPAGKGTKNSLNNVKRGGVPKGTAQGSAGKSK